MLKSIIRFNYSLNLSIFECGLYTLPMNSLPYLLKQMRMHCHKHGYNLCQTFCQKTVLRIGRVLGIPGLAFRGDSTFLRFFHSRLCRALETESMISFLGQFFPSSGNNSGQFTSLSPFRIATFVFVLIEFVYATSQRRAAKSTLFNYIYIVFHTFIQTVCQQGFCSNEDKHIKTNERSMRTEVERESADSDTSHTIESSNRNWQTVGY